jgi:LacI family transcriptional regulator
VRRPTIRDVARAAGVSTATVSHVLNRPELVAAATRERVQGVIDELGFVRNSTARRLSDGRSLTVGVVVQDGRDPFFVDVARGVEDAVADVGYVTILCDSASSPEREQQHLRRLEEQRPEGLVISPVGLGEPSLSRLHAGGAAIVQLYRHSRRRDRCSLAVDDVAGGRLAAQHLLDLGHRRVALVSPPLTGQNAVDRRDGFLAALAEAGRGVGRGLDVETGTAAADGAQATGRLLDRARRPTAVFCSSDLLAVGALRAAIDRRLAVPGELAIVGFDDLQFAAHSPVPLTSIHQPTYEIGRRAGELLLDEVRDRARHRHRHDLLRPSLVTRESTIGRAAAAAGVSPQPPSAPRG